MRIFVKPKEEEDQNLVALEVEFLELHLNYSQRIPLSLQLRETQDFFCLLMLKLHGNSQSNDTLFS